MPNETRKIEPGDRCYRVNDHIAFECPGCEHSHAIIEGRWSFNGDYQRPTFSPSILCQSKFGPSREPRRCHSFVRDGRIEYLSDCTHKLAGKTVDLPEV